MTVEQFLATLTVLGGLIVAITGYLTYRVTRRVQAVSELAVFVTALQTQNKQCQERLEKLEGRQESLERRDKAHADEIETLAERNKDLDYQVRSLREALRAYRRDTPPGGMRRPGAD